MADVNKTATITVKAVTAPMEAGIKGATGSVNALADALNKVKTGLNYLQSGVQLGQFAADMERLGKAVPSAELEALQRATGNTVDKMSLLSLASRNLTGDLRLSQAQLVDVAGAAQALHERGFGPTIEIANKLSDALRTGREGALKEYGIEVDNLKDKHALMREELRKFHDLASDTGPVDARARSMEQFSARLQDSLNQLKQTLGDFVIGSLKYLNMLLDGVTTVAGNLAGAWHYMTTGNLVGVQAGSISNSSQAGAYAREYANNIGGYGEFGGAVYGLGNLGLGYQQYYQTRAANAARADQDKFNATIAGLIPELADQGQDTLDALTDQYGGIVNSEIKPKRPRGGGGKRQANYFEQTVGPEAVSVGVDLAYFGAQGAAQRDLGGLYSGVADSIGAFGDVGTDEGTTVQGGLGRLLGGIGSAARGLGRAAGSAASSAPTRQQIQALQDAQSKQQLAQLQSLTSAAGSAANAGVSALSAAVDAAVAGGKGIAAAAEAAAKASLRATAVKAITQAAWETAEGLAALAIGGPFGGASATAHFKAAAAYAATAAVAGGLSAAIPGGGSSGGGQHAAGTPGAGSSTGSFFGSSPSNNNQGGPTHVTVNMYGLPPGADAAKIGQSVQYALDQANKAGRTRGGSVVVQVR